MAVTRELDVVRADLNDEYGVSLWVRKKLTELTPDEAEGLAEDLLRVAAQGRALRAEDEAPMLEELRARLSEGTLTVDAARAAAGFPDPHTCRVCGCTTEDCSGCIARTGGPCWWVEVDLCSACAPAEFGEKRAEPKTATHGVFTLTVDQRLAVLNRAQTGATHG